MTDLTPEEREAFSNLPTVYEMMKAHYERNTIKARASEHIDALKAENERLRDVIKNEAPHYDTCATHVGGQCDCWKCEALESEGNDE